LIVLVITIVGKTALCETQPSSEDPARFDPVFTSLYFATIIFSQSKFFSLAPNPNLKDQVSIFMSPSKSVVGGVIAIVAGFLPRRAGFELGSGYVGFVMDKVALGQVFSEYFGFPCHPSFHQLLQNDHNLSSGDGTIGQ
jgi:hypothetical protein